MRTVAELKVGRRSLGRVEVRMLAAWEMRLVVI
jgi:hypothetical protein